MAHSKVLDGRADSKVLDDRDAQTTRVVIFGKSGVGKSALGNMLLKQTDPKNPAFVSKSYAGSVTNICNMSSIDIENIRWYVVDTPGFWDPKRDSNLKKEIEKCFVFLSPGFHVALYAVSAAERFMKDDIRVLELFEKWFGKKMFQYLQIVITKSDQLDESFDTYLSNCDKELEMAIINSKLKPVAVCNRGDISGRDELIQAVKRVKQRNSNSHYTSEDFMKIEAVLLKIDTDLLEKIRIEEEAKLQRQLTEIESGIKEAGPGVDAETQRLELEKRLGEVKLKHESKLHQLAREETLRQYQQYISSAASLVCGVIGEKVGTVIDCKGGSHIYSDIGKKLGTMMGSKAAPYLVPLFQNLSETTKFIVDQTLMMLGNIK